MRRRWQILTAGVVVAAVTACSGTQAPTPTASDDAATDDVTTSAGVDVTPQETAEAERPWCEGISAPEGTFEVEFGPMSAASDEWSAQLGREWRHYIPTTVRNTGDKPCLYQVRLNLDVESGASRFEQVNVALAPGQAYHFQAYDLESAVEFDGDSADAEPTARLTPSFDTVLQHPLVPVYDVDLDVEGVSGEGGDSVLIADLTVLDESWEFEDRPTGVDQDKLFLNGLDENGDIIARAYTVIDAAQVGQTVRVEIPIGGGGSASSDDEELRNLTPVSVYEDVVSWEIGALQPDTVYWLSR